MPDGQKIEVHDISTRQFVVPVGTTLTIPDGHEWYVMGIAVLPVRGYTPPLGAGEVRNARAWGDLQLRVNDSPDAQFRANVLTLIDRYWGRYNLNPTLPEITARLTAAQQAMYTAPKISELYTMMDHLLIQHAQYLDAAAPKLETSLTLRGGWHFTVECVASVGPAVDEVVTDSQLGTVDVKVLRALDVELSMIIKRPVT